MPVQNTFSAKLRALRKKWGMSQTALANAIGVSKMTICRWEWGQRTPRIDEIKKLCEVLGVSEAELLNGPEAQTWELRVIYKKQLEGEAIDLTGNTSSAVVLLEDRAMSIKIDGPIDLWADDTKFEDLIADLRRKREAGMKTRKEGW